MQFRFGSHAVVVSDDRPERFLMLRPSYLPDRWALPGGHVDAGEDARSAVIRECREELALIITVEGLTGLYFQPEFDAQLAVFRATIPAGATVVLSDEHIEHRWMDLDELRAVMRSERGDEAVAHALRWDGTVAFGRY